MFVCLVCKLRAGTQVYIGHVASIQAAALSLAVLGCPTLDVDVDVDVDVDDRRC